MMRNIPLSVPNLSLDILENVKETIETGTVVPILTFPPLLKCHGPSTF